MGVSSPHLLSTGTALDAGTRPSFPIDQVRRDFPILTQPLPDGRPLIYLDTGATAQKPQVVIDAVSDCYAHYNANVHRGVHPLHERVTEALEQSRRKILKFLGGPEVEEWDEVTQVIFTAGTTMAINLVAQGWGRKFLRPGDEILLSALEHHANFLPWQVVAQATGATLREWPLLADGQLDLAALDQLLGPRTRLVALTGMSNVLGTIPPVREIIQRAHAVGALVLVDGAQSVPHGPSQVVADDVDFLAFSGHKLYGPTGVGVLYAKPELLAAMDPLLTGGNMVDEVSFTRSTYKAAPFKFEAGTLPIAEAIGLGAAVDYVEQLGRDAIQRYEHSLLEFAHERLAQVPGLTIHGPSVAHKGAIVSFTLDGVPAHDVGTICATRGIAIRASHHCAQPLHHWLGVDATCRASLAFYNTRDEIEVLAETLTAGAEHFRRGRAR